MSNTSLVAPTDRGVCQQRDWQAVVERNTVWGGCAPGVGATPALQNITRKHLPVSTRKDGVSFEDSQSLAKDEGSIIGHFNTSGASFL